MVSVIKLEWGSVWTSDNKLWKDAVVRYDGSREWDWTLDGTQHQTGITAKALKNIEDCDVIILTKGMHNKLNISSAITIKKDRRILILPSTEAVNYYNNELANGRRVGMLLHSTC